MLLFCTFIFCCIVIWFISKDHSKEVHPPDHYDRESHLTAQEYRVMRYMRHREKFGKGM